VLLGSLFVQAYLFLAWLEARALAKSLARRGRKARARAVAWVERHLDADLGSPPPVPWLLAGIFLALPLVILMLASPKLAIAVVVLHLFTPLAFARLDR
jgi:hypothetical protein